MFWIPQKEMKRSSRRERRGRRRRRLAAVGRKWRDV